MKWSPRLIPSWMFNYNLISSTSVGFFLYFNRNLCSYSHEPIVNRTYHGVCCLCSEFTTFHKWDSLLETLTDSLFCIYYFSGPFHHSAVLLLWGWAALCTLKYTIYALLFLLWSVIKLDFSRQVANHWFKPAMQVIPTISTSVMMYFQCSGSRFKGQVHDNLLANLPKQIIKVVSFWYMLYRCLRKTM